jgi:hypothetical protein
MLCLRLILSIQIGSRNLIEVKVIPRWARGMHLRQIYIIIRIIVLRTYIKIKQHISLELIQNEYHTKLRQEHYRNNTITRH